MSKKSKKKTAPAEAPLSKKERKRLAAEAERIERELAERKAAAKKAKKKGKKAKAEKPAAPPQILDAKAERAAKRAERVKLGKVTATTAPIGTPAEEMTEKKAKRSDALSAGPELDAALAADTDAAIKARVNAKREARERDERLAAQQVKVAADRAERVAAAKAEAEREGAAPDTERSDEIVKKATEAFDAAESRAKEAQVAEVVETEAGREIVVGTEPEAPVFAKPSEAPRELEEGRNGYKIIMLDADGKPDPKTVRQMTRVTTFVGNIDDETMIRDWEKRLLAEGLSASADEYAPRVNDLVHRRDVTIAKARKADRKGKLDIGELGDIEADAMKAYRAGMKELIDEALEAAGRHEAAEKGTNLHALAELADAEGIDAVRSKHEDGEISATDLASIEAYVEAMQRIGAKVIAAEAVIVNDAMRYAGRLDRVYAAKLPALFDKDGTMTRPADVRSKRYIGDIKSGRIDLGAGKIARQLAAYAHGDYYDLETGARTKHSAGRDVALLIHLPQGKGTCHVYIVDLKEGLAGLKLSASVRAARNTGKKAVDLTTDLAATPSEG